MEQEYAGKSFRHKRAVFTVLAVLLLVLGLLPALFPSGYSSWWQAVYSSFGLSDFSSIAKDYPMSLHYMYST